MTQLMARYTSLIDGRKTVKMTGRVYLRAIVPIGVFFSLSLICGNVTYLYLSVAFIQMLKVGHPRAAAPARSLSSPNMPVTGHDPRCRPLGKLVLRSRPAQPQGVPERLRHRLWCHPRLHRRDQIRAGRRSLSDRWHRLRGPSLDHGPEAAELGRLQDGPPRVPVLLRPGLCRHQPGRCPRLGGPQGHHG